MIVAAGSSSALQILLHALDRDAQRRREWRGVAKQVAAAGAVAFHGRDAAAAERGERHGKQSDPGVQVQHRSVSGHGRDHFADECGQQKTVRLEERFGVPLEGAFRRGSGCQHRQRDR